MSKRIVPIVGLAVVIVFALMSSGYAKVNIEVILDVSSQVSQLAEGQSRLDVVQKALVSFLDGIPQDANVGLRIYGMKGTGPESSGLIIPMGQLDKPVLISGIFSAEPTEFAFGASRLEEILEDFQDLEAGKIVVLICTGDETYEGDIVAAAHQLSRSGIKMYILGYSVAEIKTAQLQQMADAGVGKFYQAEVASDVATGLESIKQEIIELQKEITEEIPLNKVFTLEESWKIIFVSYKLLEKNGIQFSLIVENLQDQTAKCHIGTQTYLIDELANEYRRPDISMRTWTEIPPNWPVNAFITFLNLKKDAERGILTLSFHGYVKNNKRSTELYSPQVELKR